MHKTQAEIAELIIEHSKTLLGNLDDHDIKGTDSLVDLGANSVDRAEIIALVLESLELDIPRVELFGAENIEQLAGLIYGKQP